MRALSIDISGFIAKCQKALVASEPTPINYQDRVALENNELPPSLGGTPVNVYALWKRPGSSVAWKLMYIGERKSENGWGRVKQHLFSTPSGTQSKLGQVRNAIEAGEEIGVTTIHVEPDSMRLAVEEELIASNIKSPDDLPWNVRGRPVLGSKKKNVRGRPVLGSKKKKK